MNRPMTAPELEDWLDEIDEAEEEQAEDGEDFDDEDLGGDDLDDDLGAVDDEDEDDARTLVLGDDEEPDEDEGPSRRGRAEQRINQLTGKARAAEQEAIAERKRRQELERRLQELERERMKAESEGLADQEKAARAALKAAYEDDDAEKIADAHARLTALEVRKARAADHPPPADESESDSELAPAAQAWVERNSKWFNKPGSETRTKLAVELSNELRAEGYDVAAPGFYSQLDRRMKQRIEQQRGQGRRPNAAAVPRGGDDGSGTGLRDQQGYKAFLSMTGERDSKRMRQAWQQRNELVD